MRHSIAIMGLVCPLIAGAQPSGKPLLLTSRLGDSVRVLPRNGAPMLGTLARVSTDSVSLSHVVTGERVDMAFALADVEAIEAKGASHMSKSEGSAFAGLGLGALGGAGLVGLLTSTCKEEGCIIRAIAMPVFMLGGAIIGLMIGMGHDTQDWEIVWRPAPRAGA